MRASLLLLALLALLCGLLSVGAAAPARSPLQRLQRHATALVEADAELAIDADAGVDVALDAEAELDSDLEADADADVDADAELDAEARDYSLTSAQLASAVGCSASVTDTWLAPINAAAAKFNINTAKRMAGFLSQVAHETGAFEVLSENLNYDAAGLTKTFPSYFNAKNAAAYSRNPQKIANRAYAGRMGNGNEASGDGWKYRGRGLIQVTGKSAYQQCGAALGLDLMSNPDLLTQPANAAMSAAWFWDLRNINTPADSGNVRGMTALINSGLSGLADRQKRYNTAKAALGA